ncbi:unnamed protein product [Schistosoma mattheei]|uniref:HECT-type E3 ubiquitin transferase n=1 Tax=Schistosoma mattheei TaxID=31246 RepID=A0A183Q7B7_9TREM|nr:unnamed protein product [Schistosoma mattheei]
MVQSIFGQSETIELKPGGKHIPVTEENRVEYVHLIANYKLNKMVSFFVVGCCYFDIKLLRIIYVTS